jgi:hypothetical protein
MIQSLAVGVRSLQLVEASKLHSIITVEFSNDKDNVRPVIFRSDQGATFLQPTINMAEDSVFAHVYAVFEVSWHRWQPKIRHACNFPFN